MKTTKRFLVVLAAGVVLVCVGVYLVRAHRESERKHEAVKLGIDELPQAAATNVQPLPPPKILPVAEETQGIAKSSETGQGAPSSEQRKPSELALIRPEKAQRLRRILAQQTKDPNWSADTEKRIVVAFSKKLPEGSMIRNVECRSSLCLVDLQQKTTAQFEQFVRNTLRTAPSSGDDARFWGLSTAVIADMSDSGEVSVVVALGRDGHDFPHLAQ